MESISERVKSLRLNTEQLIVVASAVMEVLGIRKAGDIDLVGSLEILQKLEEDKSWKKHFHDDGSYVYLKDNFEIGNNWLKDGSDDNFDELIGQTFEIDGVKYVKPELVLKWKRKMNRPKDQEDIKLLEELLNKS